MTDFKNTNTFDGSFPKSVKEETNLNLWLSLIGEQFYNSTQSAKRKIKEYSLLPKTDFENFTEEKMQLLATFHTEGNPLRTASHGKQFLCYIGAIFSILAEYFVFRHIAENALGMLLIETYFVAFFSVVFTKFIQVVFQRRIKSWLKENSRKLRSLIKTLLYGFAILILINGLMAGITNLYNIEQQRKIEQIEILSLQIEQSQGGDRSALEADLQKAQNDLTETNNVFFLIARFCAVALLGLLAIACGAVLWSMADFYTDALRLQKRVQALNDKLSQLRANFHSYLQTFDDLLSLQKDLLVLYGQKAFLEKLMSKEQEKALEITNETKS